MLYKNLRNEKVKMIEYSLGILAMCIVILRYLSNTNISRAPTYSQI